MPTAAAPPGDDDDDDFDWDAAVREIDDACQGAAATSCHLIAGPSVCVPSTPAESNGLSSKAKAGSSLRQVTLDKFVKNHGRQARPSAGHVRSSPVIDLVEDGCAGGEDMRHPKIDMDAAKTWIYPVNVPLRDYQFNITKTALFSNTLVALPTGLGKTLIAAVVMYNYFRWFPEGKIVFAAPSRPLVLQQIEACHKTVGIPQEWTIDLTGQTNPCKRAHFWKSKRVFFVTPQVLEKDIQSGTCLVSKLVCLVIDEAHRAMGNYAYCVAIRELMAIPVQFRILGLSATPGAKQETIQKIIDNLHISTLEFRNEDDYDVGHYVHNRKLELLKVPMGNDAVEINNLLLETIRPFAAKLSTLGVLPKRDLSAMSPHELVALREQFRQAPPLGFPPSRKGEIEGCFLTLVTLYHVRKLLSSHGIRPAFEMFEEKCKQGPFSILMSKNEKMWKAKLLMQQSISHGALSPKLLKLVEVLLDHFKNNDPKKSRVIVFSNFRESVKDILDTLASIGDVVRATQFIGQSSGRTSKGQSQKIQQEVLQKFRSGGYNVLVATSIAEEGLDIMEVDLVICFDANISPLRMIQRMGRTGRKHDGRVVVLACEGTELKGYHRKQANSKAVRKHMHNGGVHSFEFHSSPRMVPHICKPEVQFVEMSIEQFVPRGKKLKDNIATFSNKISCDEEKLISKYFGPFHEGNMWKPSLIAFPCFQAIPSSVHKVKHSNRTTEMLIDTMGVLQGLSIFKADEVLPNEEHCCFLQVKSYADRFLECKTTATDDCKKHGEGSETIRGAQPCQTADVLEPSLIILDDRDDNNMPDDIKDPHHTFLFNADLVSVDLLGKVLVLPVPSLPFFGAVANFIVVQNENMPTSSLPTSEKYQPEAVYEVGEMFIESPVLETKISSLRDDRSAHPASRDSKDDELRHGSELSPRLTNYIEKGVVPESPIIQNHCTSPSLINMDTSKLLDELPSSTKKSCSYSSEKFIMDNVGEFKMSSKNEASVICSCKSSPPIEICVPFVDPTNLSSTEDWRLSSGEAENSVQPVVKFKRLRKREIVLREPLYKNMKEATENYCRSVVRTSHNYVKHIGENRLCENGIKGFFQEEAEVSSDTAVSADEKDDMDSDQFQASFIDDRTDPTTDSSHSEPKDSNMMAFYRRSLLSQSPAVCLPSYSTNLNSNSHSAKTIDCGSCSSDKVVIRSHPTPSSVSCFANMSNGRDPRFCEADDDRIGRKDENSEPPSKDKSRTDNRKRKLDFLSLRTTNNALDHQTDTLIGSNSYRETVLQHGKVKNNYSRDELFDDNFYEGLDLDAVEAQATMLLRSNISNKHLEVSNPCGQEDEDLAALGHPSFNLGI